VRVVFSISPSPGLEDSFSVPAPAFLERVSRPLSGAL